MYIDREDKLPAKGQLCLCECPMWCETGYQVAYFNGKEFYYPECPNEYFDRNVIAWLPLSEDGEQE